MMKRIREVILFSLMFTSIVACEKEDDEVSRLEVESGIDVSIAPDTVLANSFFKVQLQIVTPNPCYNLSRVAVNNQLNKTNIEAYTTYDPEQICITTLGRIDTEVEMSLETTGNNFLVFNENTQFQIIDTVFVK